MKYRIRTFRYPWYYGRKRWDADVFGLVAGVWIKARWGTGGWRTEDGALGQATKDIVAGHFTTSPEISDPEYYTEFEYEDAP